MLVTWHNLNFCVPLTKADKLALKGRQRQSLTAPLAGKDQISGINVRMVGQGRRMK